MWGDRDGDAVTEGEFETYDEALSEIRRVARQARVNIKIVDDDGDCGVCHNYILRAYLFHPSIPITRQTTRGWTETAIGLFTATRCRC
ncbi:MAG: hypothetical protein K0U84_20455 [Actinomycetia bacterium]|nr:hypothetical protein [Actinomycetes bacterium]